MELLILVVACFVGGFLGAFLAGKRDTSHPLPIERVITKTVDKIMPKEKTHKENDIYKSWLYEGGGQDGT